MLRVVICSLFVIGVTVLPVIMPEDKAFARPPPRKHNSGARTGLPGFGKSLSLFAAIRSESGQVITGLEADVARPVPGKA